MTTQTEKCPWCGSEITRVEFERITVEIRDEEQEKLKGREEAIRQLLEKQHKEKLEQERKKAVQAEKEAGQKIIDGLTGTVAKAQETIKKAAAREAQLKKELQEQAEEAKKKDLADQRKILDDNHNKELAKQRTEFTRERERMQKKFDDLQRQLKKQTPNELGDAAEVDLYDILREEFPDDRIKRIPKGETGADIHQQVMHKGNVCGLIVFDSKNHQFWRQHFVTKLHEDQLAAKADHAILATAVFPSGKKELCIDAGVIVVHPGRALQVVHLLRTALVKMLTRGLSLQERQGKMEELYQLITSEEHAQRFAEAGQLADKMLDLDVQEKKDHDKMWKNRGILGTKLRKTLNEIDSAISNIVEGPLSYAGIALEASETAGQGDYHGDQ